MSKFKEKTMCNPLISKQATKLVLSTINYCCDNNHIKHINQYNQTGIVINNLCIHIILFIEIACILFVDC